MQVLIHYTHSNDFITDENTELEYIDEKNNEICTIRALDAKGYRAILPLNMQLPTDDMFNEEYVRHGYICAKYYHPYRINSVIPTVFSESLSEYL